MRFIESEIAGFGKLNTKHLRFSKGINLIYGENEAGKSTLHTFLRSMLFDVERGRGRGAAMDMYHHFEPWENSGAYGGSLVFSCDAEDGERRFLLKRRFEKRKDNSSLVCLDDGEQLSVNDGDLEMILEGLTPEIYENTLSIKQFHAAPSQPLSVELQNYATNFYASGESDVNVEAAQSLLKAEKKELEKRQQDRQNRRRDRKARIEQEATFVWRDLHRLALRQEDLEEELEKRKELLAQTKGKNKKDDEEASKRRFRIDPMLIFIFAFILFCILKIMETPWNYLAAIVVLILELIYTWNRMKISKKPEEKTESEKILEEIMTKEQGMTTDQILWEIEHCKVDIEEKQTMYNNLRDQLEEIDVVEEEDVELSEQIEAVTIALDKMKALAVIMQKQLGMYLNERISAIFSELTDKQYDRVYIETNMHMQAMKGMQVVPLEYLSRGTIEQLYFAFRVAAAEVLRQEVYPILLDDTFVCYDDKRLENTLRWLEKQNRQILIFTCQKREEEIMNKANIAFHKIEL